MPLTGDAKRLWDRNYLRNKRYGNWRQIYHNNDGKCASCGVADDLDIHEFTAEDGLVVSGHELLCKTCHLAKHHGAMVVNGELPVERRKYRSKLTEDVAREMEECGSLENWKVKYGVKDKMRVTT